MADLFKSKENEFYITLKQERFYSPGEDIFGEVVLDLKKATKTNNIKVVLEGIVEIGGRNISLFSKPVTIAESQDGDKSYYLEACSHRFPFMITIPTQEQHDVPSSLEISKLLKVSYRLVAIYNKAFSVLEKFCPTTSSEVTILEKINVEDDGFIGEQKAERELILTGETRKVKVSTTVGKRAAVKGDVIPISIKIEHIGVIVRDKAISVQLLRSVYYGKNKSELFGPKPVREITANIEISGPICFTKTFNMQLAVPSHLCPTVDKSSTSFKIEYALRVAVNLNEENPLRPQVEGDIVIFNFPFTIGTYPKLVFNIDDDEEEAEVEVTHNDDIESNHFSEYDQVAEKMKDLEIETSPPQMIQEESITSPLHQINSTTPIEPTLTPSSSFYDITPLKRLDDTLPNTGYLKSPVKKVEESIPESVMNKPNTPDQASNFPTPEMDYASYFAKEPQSPISTSGSDSPLSCNTRPVSTSPPERQTSASTTPLTRPNIQINPSQIFNVYQPVISPAGPVPTSPHVQRHNSTTTATMCPSNSTSTINSSVGRQESVRWIVRNQEATAPAAVSPTKDSPKTPPRLPPRPTPSVSQGFVMPTPSVSQPTTNLHHPQPGVHHYHGNYHIQPSHSNQTNAMPMPQYHHQFPPYTSNINHNPYGYSQHYDYSMNNNNSGMNNNNSNVAFPVPQQPGLSGGYMNMPSYQNYQPQPSPYYNH